MLKSCTLPWRGMCAQQESAARDGVLEATAELEGGALHGAARHDQALSRAQPAPQLLPLLHFPAPCCTLSLLHARRHR